MGSRAAEVRRIIARRKQREERKYANTSWTIQHNDTHCGFFGTVDHKCTTQIHQKNWTCVVAIIHILDAVLGTVALVYGSLLLKKFDQPAVELAVTCVIYGIIGLSASLIGAMSYLSSDFNRIGLSVSGFSALLLSFLYVALSLYFIFGAQSFFAYLDCHKNVIFLDGSRMDSVHVLVYLCYILLPVIALLEVVR